MNIEKSTVTKIRITGAKDLDPITVFLEDFEPGRGKITINCWDQSWTAGWGAMSGDDVATFFCRCDEHYLAKNLSNISGDVFDQDHLIEKLKKDVIHERRVLGGSKREARARFDAIESLDLPESEEQLWSISRQLEEIIGEEWWYSLPKKPNPDYVYLCLIIKAVQAGLRQVKSGAA